VGGKATCWLWLCGMVKNAITTPVNGTLGEKRTLKINRKVTK
jgi:hypothetical protein